MTSNSWGELSLKIFLWERSRRIWRSSGSPWRLRHTHHRMRSSRMTSRLAKPRISAAAVGWKRRCGGVSSASSPAARSMPDGGIGGAGTLFLAHATWCNCVGLVVARAVPPASRALGGSGPTVVAAGSFNLASDQLQLRTSRTVLTGCNRNLSALFSYNQSLSMTTRI